MNKIALLTFTNSENYGALLQAYALQEKLSQLGYNSEFIDYRRPFRPKSRLRRVKYFVLNRILGRLFRSIRRKRTESFRLRYFRRTEPIRSRPALTSKASQYQTFIVGSDQVWNVPKMFGDDSFLLPFVSSDQKRIAYAPSFGFAKFPEDYISLYQNELRKFDSLSVREIEGRKYVNDLVGRDAALVLDPTLLLNRDDWQKIAVPYKSPHSYIFCYFIPEPFGEKKIISQKIVECARVVSEATGWEIVCCGNKRAIDEIPSRSVFNAGPLEFLGIFQNASFVLTNSFHGTAFAINYQKPFYSLIHEKFSAEEKWKSRIGTLLDQVDLKNRFLSTDEPLPSRECWATSFESAEVLLNQRRNDSIDFLTSALENAKKNR